MHQTNILQNSRFCWMVYWLRFVNLRRSFEVGNAGQSCVRSGFLPTRLNHFWLKFLGFPGNPNPTCVGQRGLYFDVFPIHSNFLFSLHSLSVLLFPLFYLVVHFLFSFYLCLVLFWYSNLLFILNSLNFIARDGQRAGSTGWGWSWRTWGLLWKWCRKSRCHVQYIQANACCSTLQMGTKNRTNKPRVTSI